MAHPSHANPALLHHPIQVHVYTPGPLPSSHSVGQGWPLGWVPLHGGGAVRFIEGQGRLVVMLQGVSKGPVLFMGGALCSIGGIPCPMGGLFRPMGGLFWSTGALGGRLWSIGGMVWLSGGQGWVPLQERGAAVWLTEDAAWSRGGGGGRLVPGLGGGRLAVLGGGGGRLAGFVARRPRPALPPAGLE